MEYVALWLIFGLVAGLVASNRGNAFSSGCLWGVFLGPLGLVIVALQTPDATDVERRQVVSGHSRKCPFCAELIKPEARVCRYCGRDVQPVRQTETLAAYCRQYLRENRLAGSEKQLRRNLVRDGWNPQIVDEAITEATTVPNP